LFILDSSTEESPPKVNVSTEDKVITDQADPEHVRSDDKTFEKQLGFPCDSNKIAKDESKISQENKSEQQEEKCSDAGSNHSSENKKVETNTPNTSSTDVKSSTQNDSLVITTSCLDKSNSDNSFATPKVECKDHSYLSSFSVNSSAPQMSLKSIMDEKIPYSMFSSNSESKLEAWATPDNSTIQVENSVLTKDDTSNKLETSVKLDGSVKLTSTPIPTKLKENLSVDNSLFEDKEEDTNGTKEAEKLCISEIPALNGNSSPTHIGIPIRQAISLTYPKKSLLKRTNLFPSESPNSKRAKVHFNEEYNHCQEYKRDVNTPMRPTHTAFIRKRNSPKRPNNPGGVNRELKFNTRAEKWLKKDMTSQHSLQLREFNRLMSHSRELKDKIQRHASSASQSGGKNYFDGLSCKELSDVLVAMHPTCQVVRALAKKLKTAKPE